MMLNILLLPEIVNTHTKIKHNVVNQYISRSVQNLNTMNSIQKVKQMYSLILDNFKLSKQSYLEHDHYVYNNTDK